MYEIHLTTGALDGAQWPVFERFAAAIGAKPMVVELARGAHPAQPMAAGSYRLGGQCRPLLCCIDNVLVAD